MVLPFTDAFEITGSLRYDDIGAVEDSIKNEDVNNSDSDFTYKVSARLQASDDIILRASYGTGFKAPSMLSIASVFRFLAINVPSTTIFPRPVISRFFMYLDISITPSL